MTTQTNWNSEVFQTALLAAVAEMGAPQTSASALNQLRVAISELGAMITFPQELSRSLLAVARQGPDETVLQNFEEMLAFSLAWGLIVGLRTREIETEFQAVAGKPSALLC